MFDFDDDLIEEDETAPLFTDMMMSIISILILTTFAFGINMHEIFNSNVQANVMPGKELTSNGLSQQQLDEQIAGMIAFNEQSTLAGNGDGEEMNLSLSELGSKPQEGGLSSDTTEKGSTEAEVQGVSDGPLMGQGGATDEALRGDNTGLKKGLDTNKNALTGSNSVSNGLIGDSIYILTRESQHSELYNIHINLLKDGQLEINGKIHDLQSVKNLINSKTNKYAVYVHLHVSSQTDFSTYEIIRNELWDRTYAARFHALIGVNLD